ncbi:4-hydroxy-tetrahydrodipicolinate reductase [Clostridium sp. E02]|uniref:4-hydroxy-tetrahydrodipicolinate reductase n=1 Tax=Clostridium sp. E02 TaxID=2487134 RepID=UPI000F535CFA|nr:4-hydroxy-tetrahydrodipicolinate reductase [Clostridium sp. E02]
MIRMIMHGCNGSMGQVITQIAAEETNFSIVAGIDPYTKKENSYPVFGTLAECTVDADVIVDFASSKAVDALLCYSVEKKIPVVVCTTGLSEEQNKQIEDAASKVAILRSANMSLGVNLLMKLVKEAAQVLSKAGFDIEILEKHHNKKLDAPSGTALSLADSINEAMDQEFHYVYDRSQVRKARDKKEIGIMAVRGGSIVGEHDVIFAGTDEVVTFQHTAYSKAIFAKGAVSAAKFLAGKKPGLYSMKDVIES